MCSFSVDFDNLAFLNKKFDILKNNLAVSKKMKKKKDKVMHNKYRGIFHVEIKILDLYNKHLLTTIFKLIIYVFWRFHKVARGKCPVHPGNSKWAIPIRSIQHDAILDDMCSFSVDFDNLSLLNKNSVILKNNLAFLKKHLTFETEEKEEKRQSYAY